MSTLEVSDDDPQPIAIHHGLVRKFIDKLGECVTNVLGSSGNSKCIESEQVAVLKREVGKLVDSPPTAPPGEALAKYRKFMESRYSKLLQEDDHEEGGAGLKK
jgi:hypothetical protein